MKFVKANLFLILVLSPVLLISDYLLARYRPEWVLDVYSFHWLAVIGVLFILCTSLGRIHLGKNANLRPRYPFKKWLGWVIGFEMSLLMVLFGIWQMAKRFEPNLSLTWSNYAADSLLHWGLFPWALMAFVAVSLGYYAYVEQKPAYTSTLLFPIFKSSDSQPFGITANVCARLAMSLVLVTSLLTLALAIAEIVNYGLGQPTRYGANGETVWLTLLIVIVLGNKKLGARIFEHMIRAQWASWKVLALGSGAIAIALVFANQFLGENLHPLELPPAFIDHAPIQALFKIFITIWLTASTSIMAIFIADISHGCQLREVLLAVIIPPLVIYGLTCLSVWDRLDFQQPIWLFLPIVGVVALLYFIMNTRQSTVMMMTLSVRADDHLKLRNQKIYLINLLRMTLGILFLYLPGGILALSLMMAAYNFPYIIYLSLGCIATAVVYFKKLAKA